MIVEECEKKRLTNPLADHDWRDINPMIHAITGQRLTSSELPEHFGLPLQGRTHDAFADTRVLLQVFTHLQGHAG